MPLSERILNIPRGRIGSHEIHEVKWDIWYGLAEAPERLPTPADVIMDIDGTGK